jgi:hypothetical protein
MSDRPPRLLGRLPEEVRLKQYRIQTGEAYSGWVRRFIFHRSSSQAAPP